MTKLSKVMDTPKAPLLGSTSFTNPSGKTPSTGKIGSLQPGVAVGVGVSSAVAVGVTVFVAVGVGVLVDVGVVVGVSEGVAV